MRSQRIAAYVLGSFCATLKLRLLLPVLALAFLGSQPASADTLYYYSGADFTGINGGDAITASEHVVIAFTVPGPLTCLTPCTVTPTTFGVGLDGLGEETIGILHIGIQTNSANAIVAWYVTVIFPTDDIIQSSTGGDWALIGNTFAQSSTPGTWTITTVPEPATFTMLGSGLLALAAAVRNRRKRAVS